MKVAELEAISTNSKNTSTVKSRERRQEYFGAVESTSKWGV